MAFFKDIYRIPSARLQHWNYTRGAWYFVTLCTRRWACFFGEVVEGELVLSPVGKIVAEEWAKTPLVRPNVGLDQWQIMPNHLHGILVIKDIETPQRGVSRWGAVETARWAVSRKETFHRNVSTEKRPRLKSNSLGSIIGQFKAACTKRIWAAGFRHFAWQTKFYDHIIRSQESLEKIRDYILHNPLMWDKEQDNPENLPAL